jgi:hypothetical protein
MENQPKEPLQFGIVRIKDISFSIHEERISPDPVKIIKVEFQNTFGFNISNGIIIMTLRVYFHYQDESPDLTLVDTSVQNLFQVQNLKQYQINETAVDLPIDFLKTIVSLTISHTRAITSKNLAGTVMQNLFLPIVNLEEVTRHFFPESFKEAALVK